MEFIDVGGSSKHKSVRNMLYQQINGVILVHDVSNRKSYYNLWRWIAEVIHSDAYRESEKLNIGGMNSSIISWGTNSDSSNNSYDNGNIHNNSNSNNNSNNNNYNYNNNNNGGIESGNWGSGSGSWVAGGGSNSGLSGGRFSGKYKCIF